MEKELRSSNFYMKYRIEVAENDIPNFDAQKDKPELFIERDYESADLNYKLYLVIPKWFEAAKDLDKSKLPYDTCKVLYDIKGIDVSSLEKRSTLKTTDEMLKIEIQRKYVFDNNSDNSMDDEVPSYKTEKYRIFLADDTYDDFSGTLMITLYDSKKPENKVIYYIAINFIHKKKITYSIARKNDNIVIDFEGKDISEKLAFRAFHNTKYMCLNEDFTMDAVNFDISFDGRNKVTARIPISKENRDHIVSICFDEVALNDGKKRNLNDFYILECKENKTLKIEKENIVVNQQTPICPYCHREIRIFEDKKTKDDDVLIKNYSSYVNVDLKQRKKFYKKGGISCQGRRLWLNNNYEKIYNNQGKIAKEVIYCEEDAYEDSSIGVSDVFNTRPRLLPDRFLSHRSNKVFILGAARAGKSTYISRLFDIVSSKGATDVNIAATSISNAVKKLINKRVQSVVPAKVLLDNNKYKKSLERWYSSEGTNVNQSFYGGYSINYGINRSYPKPTTTSNDNMSRLPFVLEVEKDDYISFYDIAGEDAQKGTGEVTRIMSTDNMGVFCLINPTGQAKEDNKKVFETLKAYLSSDKNCPIAVIVTKFDTIEKKFGPNSYCLRNDYFDLNDSDNYEESYLEHCINMSSEEIKRYLDKELPSFALNSKNIKYFGVSALSTTSAMSHEGQKETNGEEKNYLKFKCSASRIELPLIWMMKQLGIIL